MEYRIVVDSCGELTDEMKKSGIYKTASLSMEVDGVHIQDDESFDQADFLKRVAESSECPKSSCPSPEKYMELYHCEAERVYAVTLSAELSGSHNSAELGRKLYEEEYGRKQIHVFNSRSASVGESLIAGAGRGDPHGLVHRVLQPSGGGQHCGGRRRQDGPVPHLPQRICG